MNVDPTFALSRARIAAAIDLDAPASGLRPASAGAGVLRGACLLAVLIALAVLTGCAAPSRSGDAYTVRETRQPMQVQTGTIESVRVVRLEQPRESGAGTAAGAVVGGVAGSNVGRGKGAIVGSVLGAVVGGVAGSQIEKSVTDRQGWELVVRTDDGRTLALVQEVGNDQFGVGQRVRLFTDPRGQVRAAPF